MAGSEGNVLRVRYFSIGDCGLGWGRLGREKVELELFELSRIVMVMEFSRLRNFNELFELDLLVVELERDFKVGIDDFELDDELEKLEMGAFLFGIVA